MLDWPRPLFELARPRCILATARGLARYVAGLAEAPSGVELGLELWKDAAADNRRRWKRGRGDNFAFPGGRLIAKRRIAGTMGTSATSIRAFRAFCIPALQRLGPSGPTSYLEFGACCGTTVLTVLEHFPGCHIWAFEPLRDRSRVYHELRTYVPVTGNVTWIQDLFEHHADRLRSEFPGGISAVYMDTNHTFANDLGYLERLLVDRPLLAPDGLLICDDRLHSGTRHAINRFLRRYPRRFDYRLVAGRWAMFRARPPA